MTTPLPDDAVAKLFDADPTTISDADLTTLIAELRRRRNIFAADEAAASLKAKKTKPDAVPTTPELAALRDKPAGEISLGDLLK